MSDNNYDLLKTGIHPIENQVSKLVSELTNLVQSRHNLEEPLTEIVFRNISKNISLAFTAAQEVYIPEKQQYSISCSPTVELIEAQTKLVIKVHKLFPDDIRQYETPFSSVDLATLDGYLKSLLSETENTNKTKVQIALDLLENPNRMSQSEFKVVTDVMAEIITKDLESLMMELPKVKSDKSLYNGPASVLNQRIQNTVNTFVSIFTRSTQ